MVPDGWADVCNCPNKNNESANWWCGTEPGSEACQSGAVGHFVVYTPASILGFPPVTSSTSAVTTSQAALIATTSFAEPSSKVVTTPASSPAKTSTDPPFPTRTQASTTSSRTDYPAPAQTQKSSASLPIAIGVGVGIPLGVLIIGFLALSFWKEVVRQRASKSRKLSQEPALVNRDQSITAIINEPRTELADTQLPRELGDTGRRELSST